MLRCFNTLSHVYALNHFRVYFEFVSKLRISLYNARCSGEPNFAIAPLETISQVSTLKESCTLSLL